MRGSDARNLIDVIQAAKARVPHVPQPSPMPPKEPGKKRRRDNNADMHDNMSTSNRGSQSATTGNDTWIKTGFNIKAEADMNGLALDVDVPVYKRRREGTPDDSSAGTNQKVKLMVKRGFKLKIVQCEEDEDGSGKI